MSTDRVIRDDSRYLRNKKDGTIYRWNSELGKLDLLEEVTHEEAYPEAHIPEAQKKRETKMNLDTKDVPEAPPVDMNPELTKQASNLGKKASGLNVGPKHT